MLKYAPYLIIVFLLCLLKCSYTSNKDSIILLNDSLHYEKNKNKELYAYKQTAELSLKDLEKINLDLYNEVKKLKDEAVISGKAEIKIEYKDKIIHDTIEIKDTNLYKINWNFNEKYSSYDNINIKGYSEINTFDLSSKSVLEDLSMNIKIYNTITKDKHGNLKTISRSNFPNLIFENIDNYIINDKKEKKKKFGISCFGGPMYDVTNNNLGIGIGIGLTYDIIQF